MPLGAKKKIIKKSGLNPVLYYIRVHKVGELG